MVRVVGDQSVEIFLKERGFVTATKIFPPDQEEKEHFIAVKRRSDFWAYLKGGVFQVYRRNNFCGEVENRASSMPLIPFCGEYAAREGYALPQCILIIVGDDQNRLGS